MIKLFIDYLLIIYRKDNIKFQGYIFAQEIYYQVDD